MVKKSLIPVILSLLFFGDLALAIDTPTNLNVDCSPGGLENCRSQPMLRWNDVLGAVNYRVQTYGPSVEVDCHTIKTSYWIELDRLPAENRYKLTNLETNSYYCWRVRAEGEDVSNWAVGPIFKTDDFINVDPGNGDSDNGDSGNGFSGITNPLAADTLEEALNSLINFFFVLAMTLGPLMIIIAGVIMVTAAGDPNKINRAKQMIFWTAIAIVVVLFAKGLPAVIKAILGG